MNDVAIVGVGQSNFLRKWEMPITELCFESFQEAMNDVHISNKNIDASIICSSLVDIQRSPENPIADYLDLNPGPTFNIENACVASSTGLRVAWGLIKSGLYDIIAVIGVEKMSDLNSRQMAERMGRAYDITWESPFGLSMPGGYAMYAQAHMEMYGTTEEQLAKVRVKNSYYSQMNPKAVYRTTLSLNDVMESEQVAYPLKKFDCCANADGSSCMIVAKGELAKSISEIPIWIVGLGAASEGGISKRKSFTGLSCAQKAAHQAYTMAGMRPSDIDVAEVHDCFTIAEILAYEDLGFALAGEGPHLIDEKETYLEGRIPVNVDGGVLCKGHPTGATGGSQIRTIVKQLRGESGDVQVKNAEVGLAHNVGGIGHYANVTILQR